MKTPDVVEYEAVEPAPVTYRRGTVCVSLHGFHATLFRGMCMMYGEAEAIERFWWLWHKKTDSVHGQEDAVLHGSTCAI